ncbi:MAG: hypothetical protein CVV44_19250 [Spirochaetae bacterium HGW-Spirochaetae-1]|jgi:hypothetical protein|nr:MAG: hypothetical protein CVV44_19250 [Spirochaetae bacterium HGW-Spirochaetae-1]
MLPCDERRIVRVYMPMKKLLITSLFVILFHAAVFPFGKNKVDYEVFRWSIIKTIHFDIYYPGDMHELALESARIAEEGYLRIADYLNHELTDVIPIIIYPSHIAFQNNNIIPYLIGEGTGGFTEALKNRVVVPFTGSYDELRHVLTHELVHAFQFNMLFADSSGDLMSRFGFGRIPLWFVEGMSEYLSIGFDESADMVMRDALFNENYASLIDLTMMRIRSPYLLYKEGQAFFYFLEVKYGKATAGELFRDLRDMKDIKDVFKAHTGKDLVELDTEWIRFYKKRYFHLVSDKNFHDEEGEQITFHEKTYSAMNVFPAVSPDGKKVAYLSDRDIYTRIVIKYLGKKKDREDKVVKVVLEGDNTSSFEGMHLLDNNLSWSGDGKTLLFVAQARGRDVLYIIDPGKGDVLEKIILPMRSIKHPSLSRDGKQLVFTGVAGGYSDIYLYDRPSKKLMRLTDDLFTDINPVISPDNRSVYYSSNRSEGGSPFNRNYDIHVINLITGETKAVVAAEGNDMQPAISDDGGRLLFVSNRSGIYNVYSHDIAAGKTVKLTDMLCGAFHPTWFPDGKKIAMVAYQNLGYDILLKDIENSTGYADNIKKDTEYVDVAFGPSYFNLGDAAFTGYEPRFSSDWLFLGVTGTVNYGFAGFIQMAMSDNLGNHRMVLTGNYIRQNSNNDLNFDAAYFYLKNRLDLGIGAFSQTNPFLIYSIADINDLIHNVNFGTLYMRHYGGYAIASYPFHRFLRMDMKATVARYERDYSVYDSRPDVYANLNQLAVSLSYDNVLWGPMVPADGFRGSISFEQAFNLSGQDFTFSSFDADLRKYFLINKRHIIALRGVYGKIFGPDSDSFKYYMGGFSTLRGHPFLAYNGKNMVLFNAEFRFTALEGMKLGWPLYLGIGQIGGVLFTDIGSVWDGDYEFIDKETGQFADFKTDMGFGLRFALYPIIILKLDFAWPFYKTGFGNMDIIFSLGFEY